LLWCKKQDGRLRVALRVELFTQYGPNDLKGMSHDEFAGLARLYQVGNPPDDQRPGGRRAVLLTDAFLESLEGLDLTIDAGSASHVREEEKCVKASKTGDPHDV
jgi:hypothetical protein